MTLQLGAGGRGNALLAWCRVRAAGMALLLGPAAAGKTLLMKTLHKMSSKEGTSKFDEPLPTLPTFVIDAANPTQVSSSCIQLLDVLAAEQLQQTPVLILFNKVDLPCHMSLVEMKSLFRMDDILACAKQTIHVLEVSARTGRGLDQVLKWLNSHFKGKNLP
ncbi:ADP-ribosylation factor-like protein 16 isoform X2 [Narcine bancroftii]|uniref:ADP-ribosylation factor-like protein 16 isoform X2 n=1 Tax=Narcine bancroftii TaxID=1343680 RepID=UPI0038322464